MLEALEEDGIDLELDFMRCLVADNLEEEGRGLGREEAEGLKKAAASFFAGCFEPFAFLWLGVKLLASNTSD